MGADLPLTLEQSFSLHFYKLGLRPGYHGSGLLHAAVEITCWKAKWMIDGEIRLFGGRMQRVEWWTENRRHPPRPPPRPLSSSVSSDGGLAGISLNRKYQPLLYSWPFAWLGFYPSLIIFYKAAGVISGCVTMSEHICWSKEMSKHDASPGS